MLIRSASAVALVMGAMASGCLIRGSTTPVGTAEVESARIDRDIYNSPSARYDGHTVYFYNGRWFYKDDAGWKYYTKEPPELYRNRMEKVRELPPRQAPPAPRYERRPDQTPTSTPEAAPRPTPAPTPEAAPRPTPSEPPAPTVTPTQPKKPMPPGAQPVEPPTPRMPPGAQPVEPPSKPMPPGAQPVEP